MRTALALLLVACSRPTLGFVVDPSFTHAERGEIQRAAEAWNRITVPAKHISFRPDGKWRVDEVDAVPGGWNGMFVRESRTVFVDNDPFGATTFQVALHEFGHALGLQHTTAGVMQDGPSMIRQGAAVPSELALEDVAECRRVRACK